MVFNKAKAIETKKKTDIKPFKEDWELLRGRSQDWIKAYKEAKEQRKKIM